MKRWLAGTLFLSAAALPGADSAAWIADPEALRNAVPALRGQRLWSEFATPAEQALFAGPETVYPEVPAASFDLTGFDPALLGSPVPPAGMHPRILFSPEDAPRFRTWLATNRLGRVARAETRFVLDRTLFDPASPEGRIFAQLVAGEAQVLTWAPPADAAAMPPHWFTGGEPTLGTSVHTPYLPNLLAAAAFQCWLDADAGRGRQVATALATYARLRVPLVETYIAEGVRTQRAPDTVWRTASIATGGNNLAFAYDCAAGWMDEAQRAPVRRLLALATKGRLAYGMNGPARWAETNWASWDLEAYLTALAIEGEEGADPDLPAAARRCLAGYLQWGITAQGTIFESNGKNGSGLHWAVLAMVGFARRGDQLFGHPHLRRLPQAQAQAIAPAGGTSFNNGTWGNAQFGGTGTLLSFYPTDPVLAFLHRQARPEIATLDPERVAAQLGKGNGWRKITLLTPGHSLGPTPYSCSDGPAAAGLDVAAQRAALQLPLAVADAQHGLLQVRASDAADALYLMFEARANLSTVGHQHHDAGHFYLTALGETWAVENGAKSFNSSEHNVVRIDGLGLADVAYPPKVRWLGATVSAAGALASADVSNAYNYAWTNPTQFQWTIPAAATWKLSVETDPEVVAFFRGTQHYPMRLWGDHHWRQNWGPTMRVASANPVRSASRTAGLVRGAHPYALIVDDVDKGDGATHLYEWTMQVPASVRLAQLGLPAGNPAAAVLVRGAGPEEWRTIDVPVPPPRGTPALLVSFLDRPTEVTDTSLGNTVNNAALPIQVVTTAYAGVRPGQVITRGRLQLSQRAAVGSFRLLLLPFRIGEALPAITWEPTAQVATVRWADQVDAISLRPSGTRTGIAIRRGGSELLTSP